MASSLAIFFHGAGQSAAASTIMFRLQTVFAIVLSRTMKLVQIIHYQAF